MRWQKCKYHTSEFSSLLCNKTSGSLVTIDLTLWKLTTLQCFLIHKRIYYLLLDPFNTLNKAIEREHLTHKLSFMIANIRENRCNHISQRKDINEALTRDNSQSNLRSSANLTLRQEACESRQLLQTFIITLSPCRISRIMSFKKREVSHLQGERSAVIRMGKGPRGRKKEP